MNRKLGHFVTKALGCWLAAATALWSLSPAAWPTPLADSPILATTRVPPNMLFTLSVEWPTGVVAAYNDNHSTTPGFECSGRHGGVGVCYFENRTYLGYFDPQKCYAYVGNVGTPSQAPEFSNNPSDPKGYFDPVGYGTGPFGNRCSGSWSGNYLNWATMQAIDTFRWVLTGGDRVIDTPTMTIVEKARHTGEGAFDQYPVKRIRNSAFTQNGITVPAVNPSHVTPFNTSRVHLRVHGGFAGWVNFTGGAWLGPQIQVLANNSDSADWGSSAVRTYYLRLRVCKPGLLEENCRQYGSSWKPNGLIQDNAQRMRFGLFSYLLDRERARRGGVLRARLKDVGPMTINPVGPSVPNPRREFSAENGTLVANPDSADAAASGVTRSGVINYINKFGKVSNLLKETDPIGELYYEALRYLKNMGSATPEFVAGVTSAMRENFPVITTWDDPIQYSCQKSYLVMIADVNAWCDYALPGTSITHAGFCSGHSHVVSNPIPGLNVSTEVNRVAAIEGSASWVSGGYGNLATQTAPIGTFRGNTWYLAGLAYWANVTNLRPDRTAGTRDRVTAKTYMVDVAETGSWFVYDGSNRPINQMWLAAKYGGFDDINLDGVPANARTWDKNGDGIPDNYFLASRPDLMRAAFRRVFEDAFSRTEAAAGATLISSQVQSGDSVYQVQYTSNGWIGDVFGSSITFDVQGNPTLAPAWNARPLLDALVAGGGWNTARRIVTYNGSVGVPFRWANLPTALRNTLGPNDTVRQEVLNYLRGDRSKEGNPYRVRYGILGDVVNAEAVPVAQPLAIYSDSANPGYSAFKAAHASRPKVVYVAANDGMLHAFDGSTTTANGGKELFAYVPSFLFNGPSTPASPTVDGLAALAQPAYTHRFYVDATPVVNDVDFARTGGDPTLPPRSTATPDWRSILVGGLGKGGRGYYALDVTTVPGTSATESAIAQKVLWEFTEPDMGFTYGKPVIAKLRKYGWVVIVPSGYNNLGGPNPGKGFLYILNAKTGALLEKIGTGVGSVTNPSGFAHIAGYAIDFSDYTVSEVYGGDLFGNVWRFDLTRESGPYPAPVKIAELRDAANNPQPITVAPRIEVSLDGLTRWVFVGTGKLLHNGDMGDDQPQTFYAFKDGTKTTPATADTLPSGISHPLRRSDFVSLSSAQFLTGVRVPPDKIGWLHDLTGRGPDGATERVSYEPVANAGIIAWVGSLPSDDPCAPGLSSRVYAVSYETGKTALLQTDGGPPVAFVPFTAGLVKLQFIKAGDTVRLLVSDRERMVAKVPGMFAGAVQAPRRLNWRVVLQ